MPQQPVSTKESATCSQCFRINRSDARFCDWCGAKPQKNLRSQECGRCGGHNNPYSKFCVACGSLISPPSNINPNASSFVSFFFFKIK